MKFGKAIRILRATRNLSQKELSEKIRLDYSYISRIEAGTRVPSTEVLKCIADALAVPFYLLVLLASDKKELDKKSGNAVDKIGQDLLEIVINA